MKGETKKKQKKRKIKHIFFLKKNIFFQLSFATFEQPYTVADLSNTRVLLLVNKIYTTENKYLLEIYAIVKQVTLRPKELIHMFVT